MATRTIPTIPQTDVASHNSESSCYVTIGSKVYDVTAFLDDHPGGPDLVLEYAGKDVRKIMSDEISHAHSDSAYEMLEEYMVGYVPTDKIILSATDSSHPDSIVPLPPSKEGVAELEETKDEHGRTVYKATGMASEEDLNKETDIANDYKRHKFLDLNRPLLPQVWFGGFSKDFYLEQVHRPRHYKGGASAPIFGNFLEPLTLTPWYVVPAVWWPCVTYGTYRAAEGFSNPAPLIAYWILGTAIWTLVEYGLHRCLFHVDHYLPDNRVGITLHFLLHGIHHYLPMDRMRLVMPPTLFIILAVPFWHLAHTLFAYNWYAATAVFCGGVFGYTLYDMTHYFLHHKTYVPSP